MIYTIFASPIGQLLLAGEDTRQLSGIYFEAHKRGPTLNDQWQRDDNGWTTARKQLTEYFEGTRKEFDLPFQFRGTPFQRRVWDALRTIPFGTTVTYSEIAGDVSAPDAVRAVGAAVGRNPLSIVVPCHRVVGSNGSLTGFAGGLERKHWLLEHEQAPIATNVHPLFARSASRQSGVRMM